MGIDGIHELDNLGEDLTICEDQRKFFPIDEMESELLESRRRRISGEPRNLKVTAYEIVDGEEVEIKHERNIFADPPRDLPDGGVHRKPGH